MQILSKARKHWLPLRSRRTYLVQNAILIGTTEHTKHTETEPCLSVCSVRGSLIDPDSDPDPDLDQTMKP